MNFKLQPSRLKIQIRVTLSENYGCVAYYAATARETSIILQLHLTDLNCKSLLRCERTAYFLEVKVDDIFVIVIRITKEIGSKQRSVSPTTYSDECYTSDVLYAFYT